YVPFPHRRSAGHVVAESRGVVTNRIGPNWSRAKIPVADANCVGPKSLKPQRGVIVSGRALMESLLADGSVALPTGNEVERLRPNRRIINPSGEVEERIPALSGVVAGIASVWCRGHR